MDKGGRAAVTVAKAEARPSAGVSPSVQRLESSPANTFVYLQHTIGNQAVVNLLRSGQIQAKLKISQAGDEYEQEADRVADQVMRTPADTSFRSAPPSLQRKCATCATGAAPCASRAGEAEELRIHRKPDSPAPVAEASVPDNFVSHLGPGQRLDPATRSFFEPRFGRDFSNVRIHTDSRAAESARAVNARAFTVGRSIAFEAGEYTPETSNGLHLLSHELAHVAQQSSPGRPAQEIHRKPKGAARDKCEGSESERVENPCARWSGRDQLALLAPYSVNADEMGGAIYVLSKVIESTATPVERARLLRIACCQLEPADAASARDAFIERRGPEGKIFRNLATPTRCDLLAILDNRASRAGFQAGAAVQSHIKAEQKAEEHQRAAHRAAVLAAAERCKRDKEYHDKAGQIGILDVLMPAHVRPYRIQYAPFICDDVLRESAMLAERTASVSIPYAIAEPITRPLTAVVMFFDCFASSMKGKDFKALESRLGLKLAAAMTVAFAPGVIIGATEEIGRIAEQLAKIIRHPIQFLEALKEFLELLWDPNSADIACAMGSDLAESTKKDVKKLADLSDLDLAYELGKLAGPLLLNTLLAIIAPEVIAGIKGTRIGRNLIALMEKLGGKLKFLNKFRKGGEEAVELEKSVAKKIETAEAAAGARAAPRDIPAAPKAFAPGAASVPASSAKLFEGVSEDIFARRPGLKKILEEHPEAAKLFKICTSPCIFPEFMSNEQIAERLVHIERMKAAATHSGVPFKEAEIRKLLTRQKTVEEVDQALKAIEERLRKNIKTAYSGEEEATSALAHPVTETPKSKKGSTGPNAPPKQFEDLPQQLPQGHEDLAEKLGKTEVKGKVSAGIKAHPKHHVFPQEWRTWFEERGFTREYSIDNFTVELEGAEHEAVHGGGDYRLGRTTGFEWNWRVMDELLREEDRIGRRLTRREIFQIVERNMKKYKIPKKYVSY